MSTIRYLTSDDVLGLAETPEYVEAVRDAYRQRGEGAPAEPRTLLQNAEPPGALTSYLAILPDSGVMGGYTYSAGFGARDAWFALPLFDAESGELLALIEGAGMNPGKTGAVGAVGVDALARDDAARLAIVGSGTQARGQLVATATVRDFESVAVYSPTRGHREAFAEEAEGLVDVPVSAVDSSAAALDGADVVITATTADDPVFASEELADGTHVTAMGQYHPKKAELDPETVARSVYVPDLRARAMGDAGSFIRAVEAGAVSEDHVHGELGEVIVGDAPGRASDEDVTVFDSGGTALETVAVGNLLYERALDADLGEELEFPRASEAR